MSRASNTASEWQGPALLSYGFRPFFLGAAVWAVVAMAVWSLMLAGKPGLPTAFDPVSWHAHALLYGYLPAVVAGFLLTAVPNWTGRPPIVGRPLALLFGLWLAGRVAVAVSAHLSALLTALIDLAMPLVLCVLIAREIVAGRNWRNLMVLAMVLLLAVGNGVFHWEAAMGTYAAQGYGLRMGLGAAVLMIAVIGGRVVPSFTRNWLALRQAAPLPTPPMQVFDKIALLVLLGALVSWVALPTTRWAAGGLAVAGLLHILRLARWRGHMTLDEPLVTVLHIAYAFVPLGALALEGLVPGMTGLGAAQHVWMAGAIGLMTLAIMTRATLGHTGRPLVATAGTLLIFAAVILSVACRVAAGVFPGVAAVIYSLSAAFWIAAFAGFFGAYGRLMTQDRTKNDDDRPAPREGNSP